MEAKINADEADRKVLERVARNFTGTKKQGGERSKEKSFRDLDLNQVMRSFETFQNYLLATSCASEELISNEVLENLQETMRMLPTKDFEFNFLADFLMVLNQTLTVAANLKN